MCPALTGLANPMAMKGPYRTSFPVGPQTVTLNVPESRQVARARLLAADTMVPIERSGSAVKVTVPSGLDHEVIAFEL